MGEQAALRIRPRVCAVALAGAAREQLAAVVADDAAAGALLLEQLAPVLRLVGMDFLLRPRVTRTPRSGAEAPTELKLAPQLRYFGVGGLDERFDISVAEGE